MDLLSMRRTLAGMLAAPGLRRLSSPQTVESTDKPLVFAVVRNEALRLPAFLAHYRNLGAGGFVVVENNSTDSTAGFLASQTDVLVYSTSDTFLRKEAWLNLLFKRHGKNRWCLAVDADEFLVFPDMNTTGLSGLCGKIESSGANALHAVLLDMLPPGAVEDVPETRDFPSLPWYFDPPALFEKRPRTMRGTTGLDWRYHGGSRLRVFGVNACCSKFPLFFCQQGMFLTDGQHALEGAIIAPGHAVLCHFKYLSGFRKHVKEEVRRGQHWNSATEYSAYAAKMEPSTKTLLRGPDSLLYQGTAQLQDLGLVTPHLKPTSPTPKP